MDAAVIELSAAAPTQRLDTDRLRDMLLLRLAVSDKPLPRDTILRDLGAYTTHLLGADAWRALLDRNLAALSDAGLADVKPTSAGVTEAGSKRAVIMFAGRAPFPRTWAEARDTRLIARAIGIDNEAAARIKALAKPDGLRAAILVKAFGLKLRGTPSPVKLRIALAKLALSRAFGNTVETTQGRSGISAKAGRALAGRLATVPRDHKTDGRLVTALAADRVNANGTDLQALQLALLRRFVTVGDAPASATKKARRTTVTAKRRRDKAASHAASTMPPTPSAATSEAPNRALPRTADAHDRPSLQVFAEEVRTLATPIAEGFSGNRKAFISRVWSAVAAARAHWGLSDVEFKCMLAEAHRVGALVLANADLKDGRLLADIQASAVSYRNAVFHYIRIDT